MSEVINIDKDIQESEKAIALHQKLLRLEKNPEFKELILEGFLKEFALEQVHYRTVSTDEKFAGQNLRLIEGVGVLASFLRNTRAQGVASEVKLVEQKAMREEILGEGFEV